jgi:hypothetical protein
MSTNGTETMNPEEQAFFTSMTERLRQLRRQRGVPNGVSLTDAIALHMLSAKEVEDARWGDATWRSPRADASPS